MTTLLVTLAGAWIVVVLALVLFLLFEVLAGNRPLPSAPPAD